MQNHFSVQSRSEQGASVLALAGELDLASGETLEHELDKLFDNAGTTQIVLDLRELEFMDSTGLSVVVKAHQRAEEQGIGFALVKGTPQVQRLLSLTGVSDRIQVAEGPEELLGGSG